jgi:K+-transporting ATPase ATPase B chain
MKIVKTSALFHKKILIEAIRDSFKKLSPAKIIKNPVICIVAIGALIATLETLYDLLQHNLSTFDAQISLWLWFTVLFPKLLPKVGERPRLKI